MPVSLQRGAEPSAGQLRCCQKAKPAEVHQADFRLAPDVSARSASPNKHKQQEQDDSADDTARIVGPPAGLDVFAARHVTDFGDLLEAVSRRHTDSPVAGLWDKPIEIPCDARSIPPRSLFEFGSPTILIASIPVDGLGLPSKTTSRRNHIDKATILCATNWIGLEPRTVPIDFTRRRLGTAVTQLYEECRLLLAVAVAKRIARIVSAIGKRANVVVNKAQSKFASAHDLRGSFGTRWASRVKPARLQLLMRHRSIETTLKYYVEQDADEVADELWRNFPPAGVGGEGAQQQRPSHR